MGLDDHESLRRVLLSRQDHSNWCGVSSTMLSSHQCSWCTCAPTSCLVSNILPPVWSQGLFGLVLHALGFDFYAVSVRVLVGERKEVEGKPWQADSIAWQSFSHQVSSMHRYIMGTYA